MFRHIRLISIIPWNVFYLCRIILHCKKSFHEMKQNVPYDDFRSSHRTNIFRPKKFKKSKTILIRVISCDDPKTSHEMVLYHPLRFEVDLTMGWKRMSYMTN